jgi:hypothetical protein
MYLITDAFDDLWKIVVSVILSLVHAAQNTIVVVIQCMKYLYGLIIECFTGCEVQSPHTEGETSPLLPSNNEKQLPSAFSSCWSSVGLFLQECYAGKSSESIVSDEENLLKVELEAPIIINFNAW